MKLLIRPDIRLSHPTSESLDLYAHDHHVGTISPGGGVPLHSFIQVNPRVLEKGLVAISKTTSHAFRIDVTEFVNEYLSPGGVVEYLQSITNAGKWELYSTYPNTAKGIVTAYFGVLLTTRLRGRSFSIVCNNKHPIEFLCYYDKYFGGTHWYMPDGCVIGVCAKYKIEGKQDYLSFDIIFDEDDDSSCNDCYRTKVGFIDKIFFTNMPDKERIHRISGPNSNEVSYVKGGISDYLALKAIAAKHGLRISRDALTILDWGVGCGRVARQFAADSVKSSLFGIDIDRDNITWCEEHLKGVFIPVPLAPPIPFSTSKFHLIYSCSVLSHLTEAYIHLWLEELNRVLDLHGIALLSFNGSSNSAPYLSRRPDLVYNLRLNKLFDSDVNRQLEGFIDGQDYYRATFATDEWWYHAFNLHFDLIHVERSVVSGYQHIAVLRKKISI